MLDDLKRMVIFSHVVEAGSFTGAAKRLGIAKSAVSKHISLLEKSAGTRLLNRSTRSLGLTDIGESYYQNCSRLTTILQQTRDMTEGLQDEPRGLIRVSSPASFGIDTIAPLLNRFIQTYPDLKAELLLDDNVIDMTAQGIDVAIRVGWLPDSNLRARKLKDSPRLLCASPDYIKRKGLPQTPDDLQQHEWIIFTLLPTPYHCSFTKNRKTGNISIKGKIKTNNGKAVRRFLLEGAGIAALSDFLVEEDLKSGRLIRLLPDYHIADAGIYAVFQNQQLKQTKIRTFIDFLSENI